MVVEPSELGAEPSGDSVAEGTAGDVTPGTGVPDVSSKDEGAPTGEEHFYDASKVPKEHRADWVEMQGAFTKKNQAVAAVKREVDQQLQMLRAQGNKARVLDDIMKDPDVFALIQSKARGENPVTGSDDADVDPNIRAELDRAIGPLRQELQQTQAQLADQQAQAEFVRTHSDWEKYGESMQEVWREDQLAGRPLRNRDAAYDAAFRKVVLAQEKSATRQQARQAAAVQGPGTQRQTPTVAPEVKTWEDATVLGTKLAGVDLDKLP